ncbi:protoheme IX farnesyltransferase, mitochondrial [Diutina catenulata]
MVRLLVHVGARGALRTSVSPRFWTPLVFPGLAPLGIRFHSRKPLLSCHDDAVPPSSITNVDSKGSNPVASNSGSPDAAKNPAIPQNLPFKVVPREPKPPVSKAGDSGTAASVAAAVDPTSFKARLAPYIKLTKPNLTILVTLSCICSYAISPLSVSLPQLIFLTVGTALCSGAANAINQGREPEFDRKMPRTVGRPVVRGQVTPKQAFEFAAVTGVAGTAMLAVGVNPIVASLGFLNIVLYAWIYTSLKRKHIINTWVGALVGAIPPLMGWAASSSLAHPAAWCLAGLLYAWQFPHFNALSHNIASQYKDAGYVMTAAENPKLNARVALRYSLVMFPLCVGLSYWGVTDWVFPFDSAIINGWMAYHAFKFWQQQQRNYASSAGPSAAGIAAANAHAKNLFWCSVWHLPVILILAMFHKKGQWDRLLEYCGLKEKKERAMA